MPVVTRSQSKQNNSPISITVDPSVPRNAKGHPIVGQLTIRIEEVTPTTNLCDDCERYNQKQRAFANRLRLFFTEIDHTDIRYEKMMICTSMYRFLNTEMPYLVEYDPVTWIKLTAATLLRTVEFEKEKADWGNLNQKIVDEFIKVLEVTKHMTIEQIKKFHHLKPDDERVSNAWKYIKKMEEARVQPAISQRPKRNVERVDYSHMC